MPWLMLAVASAIAATGAVMLYSVAGGSFSPWAERHVLRFMAGIAGIFLIAAIPLRAWMALAYPIYLTALGLLVAVLISGQEIAGAQRWIAVAGISFQPAELMKVALILALAKYFQWIPMRRVSHPLWMVPPLVMTALPLALILKQPDLGTALLLTGTGLAILFLAGVSWYYFVAGSVVAIAGAPLLWTQLHDYQRQRIMTFLDPDLDPLGKGYQIFQSKIAFGAGGVSGQGLMNGTQSQLDFLPEKHTDFIFTMLAEELGFVASVGLLALYGLLFVLLFVIASRCRSHFARLLAAGTGAMIFTHMFVNMAMVMGLLPVVGAPLPLVSYGGTAMFSTLFALGLAANAAVHREEFFDRKRLHPLW